ncbi:TetR/AcrR family transcriptional regulator [Rhodobacter sp. HX-7-19]|uniref:TetR/AcrR family transcriptional regulator n=1 Tax=Paragemmobacter kunshanensis TaxID=2583234 RepID=A0A6M1TRJ0_9RHOB|nr:TetR/AcrR family transcriptional regulator [Rhodobacter kunshanensis]NGQ92899.1 TetR/AcrR family transcriptional regulator [Rhodobacter kunshanensis]
MSRPPKFSSEQIIAAAERVVSRLGAAGLSFEAVAREAGVSKGAVLHYFGTKDALVAAMVERLVRRLTPSADPDPASVDAGSLIDRAEAAHGARDPAAAALLAALTQDLSVLAPLRAATGTWLDRLGSSPLGPDQARLLHFALDGLWMSEVLGISPLDEAGRAAFFDHLRRQFAARGEAD